MGGTKVLFVIGPQSNPLNMFKFVKRCIKFFIQNTTEVWTAALQPHQSIYTKVVYDRGISTIRSHPTLWWFKCKNSMFAKDFSLKKITMEIIHTYFLSKMLISGDKCQGLDTNFLLKCQEKEGCPQGFHLRQEPW